MTDSISNLRQDYRAGTLERADLHTDPLEQFRKWFEEATAHCKEPNAMTLATVSDGQPDVRVVLLKSLDDQGFGFYTNKESAKGLALQQNPRAALCFWWEPLERQVRVRGTVESIDEAEATEYFKSRPRGSQLGAWASRQSNKVADGQVQTAYAEADAKFGSDIPKPEFWGGYRVVPEAIEFWQGRSSRLHDRFIYQRVSSSWHIDRLSP